MSGAILRTYKYRLRVTPAKDQVLCQQLDTLRRVYNASLAYRDERTKEERGAIKAKKAAAKAEGRKLADVDREVPGTYEWFAARRMAQVAEVKAGAEGAFNLAGVAAVALRDTLARLDAAYEAWFKRGGDGVGRPRPMRPGENRSVPFENYGSGCALGRAAEGCRQGKVTFVTVAEAMAPDADLSRHYVRVYAGHERTLYLPVRLHRPLGGKPKTITLKRTPTGKWFVTLACEVPDAKVTPAAGHAVGIDMGLTSFVVTSDGVEVAPLGALRGALAKLRIAQRTADRRARKDKNGRLHGKQSAGYGRAVGEVRKLHEYVADCRRDYHHKAALELARRHQAVVAEDLKVANMVHNRHLALSILDAGWSAFLVILKSKLESRGGSLTLVDPRDTSQACSACQKMPSVKKTLKDRTHCCEWCGLVMGRDHNAARNILGRGMSGGAHLAGVAEATNGAGYGPSPAKSRKRRSVGEGGGVASGGTVAETPVAARVTQRLLWEDACESGAADGVAPVAADRPTARGGRLKRHAAKAVAGAAVAGQGGA